MSVEGPGREYGGKKFPKDNIPFIHPGTPESNCKCDMCVKARTEDAAEVRPKHPQEQ